MAAEGSYRSDAGRAQATRVIAQPPAATIKRSARTSNQIRWPKRLAGLLGKVSDAKLAALSGYSVVAVREERRRRGIPPSRPASRHVEWRGHDRAPGRERRKRRIASFGLLPSKVVWTAAMVHFLGKSLGRRSGPHVRYQSQHRPEGAELPQHTPDPESLAGPQESRAAKAAPTTDPGGGAPDGAPQENGSPAPVRARYSPPGLDLGLDPRSCGRHGPCPR